jgi:hypothetical protein
MKDQEITVTLTKQDLEVLAMIGQLDPDEPTEEELDEIELEPDEDWDDEDAFASAGFGMDESYGMWSE